MFNPNKLFPAVLLLAGMNAQSFAGECAQIDGFKEPKIIKKMSSGNAKTVSEALKAANEKVLGGQ